jgi:hypothetical protein
MPPCAASNSIYLSGKVRPALDGAVPPVAAGQRGYQNIERQGGGLRAASPSRPAATSRTATRVEIATQNNLTRVRIETDVVRPLSLELRPRPEPRNSPDVTVLDNNEAAIAYPPSRLLV